MAYGTGPFSQYGSSGTQAYGVNNGAMGIGNGYFGSPWGFAGMYGGTPTGAETSKPGIGNNRGMTPPIQRVGGSPGQPGSPGTSTAAGGGGGQVTPPISIPGGNGPGMGGGQPPGIGQPQGPGQPGGGGRGGNQLPWAPWYHDYSRSGSGTLSGQGPGQSNAGRGSRGTLSGGGQGLGLGGSQSSKPGLGGQGPGMSGGNAPHLGNPIGSSPISTLLSYLGGYGNPGSGPFL